MREQLGLFETKPPERCLEPGSLAGELTDFVYDGRTTVVSTTAAMAVDGREVQVPTFTNEFWTSRQRAAHSLQEVSYRACFKPQLPRFFIERLTEAGACVFDPFMGRGTTPLEAALLGRRPAGNDINPLSRVLVGPRLEPPDAASVDERLRRLDLSSSAESRGDLLAFFHPETLSEICALRDYFLEGEAAGTLDPVDRWIRMVAVNRLTGHSPGFFSVYTLPPNQAVSVEGQLKINADRKQVPPRRDVKHIIARKTKSLLLDCDAATRRTLSLGGRAPLLMVGPADHTPALEDGSVDLVVTSPPFLDVVNYSADNWLRCWFCGVEAGAVNITIAKRVDRWGDAMTRVLAELHRVVRPGGHVAFEVGEVRAGTVKLEETVIPAAASVGFEPELVLVNAQTFTKTANCWGVSNNQRGTNTNRVVVLRRG
ncbi:MAG TPA: DNA methyltransferase [Vicinamibacterales bacterium]|jgi:hypothetical protein